MEYRESAAKNRLKLEMRSVWSGWEGFVVVFGAGGSRGLWETC
jgi:hypothetical protein